MYKPYVSIPQVINQAALNIGLAMSCFSAILSPNAVAVANAQQDPHGP